MGLVDVSAFTKTLHFTTREDILSSLKVKNDASN
jgi:hypothetical protein